MTAIYKREVHSLFTSMTAYIFITFYLVILGIYFRYYNLSYGATTIGYAVYQCFYIYLLFALLAMRSLPEERKEKIDQVLYTSPVSVGKIVVGKYLAMCTVWFVTVSILCVYPLVVKKLGYANLKVEYSILFAYFFLGCAFIAICMFISSLTESQLIAAILSVLVIFVICFANTFAQTFSNAAYVSLISFVIIAAVIGVAAGWFTHNLIYGLCTGICLSSITIILYVLKQSAFEGLIQNVVNKIALAQTIYVFVFDKIFDVKVIFTYLSLIVLFLFITVQTIQKRRYS